MHFTSKSGVLKSANKVLKAVDDITLDIEQGETLGLVGESGCGKSTLGRSILQLYQPTSGSVQYRGQDLMQMDRKKLLKVRQKLVMIFQDPYASLNPRMKIGEIIGEPMLIHKIYDKKNIRIKTEELMETVGLNSDFTNRYPHEFSGGQRQRIGIARALAAKPEFIVADEAISALDVSIQAQIINLMKKLQNDLGLTYLFIAHDLAVVRYISDRMAVMYLGKIVELTDSNLIYTDPLHPYTQSLLSAIPIPDPITEKKRDASRVILEGEVPNPEMPPFGCGFCTRCPMKQDVLEKNKINCDLIPPVWNEVKKGHWTACHLYS